jgi:hypothetical protein
MKLAVVAALALAACNSTTSSPDAAPAHGCMGTPTACFTLTTSTACYAELGCTPTGGTCDGVATSCSSYFDDLTCTGQPHCFWDSTLSDCSGFRSCDLQSDSGTCAQVSGCSWTTFQCNGTASKCALFDDEQLCGKQAGCYWK